MSNGRPEHRRAERSESSFATAARDPCWPDRRIALRFTFSTTRIPACTGRIRESLPWRAEREHEVPGEQAGRARVELPRREASIRTDPRRRGSVRIDASRRGSSTRALPACSPGTSCSRSARHGRDSRIRPVHAGIRVVENVNRKAMRRSGQHGSRAAVAKLDSLRSARRCSGRPFDIAGE